MKNYLIIFMVFLLILIGCENSPSEPKDEDITVSEETLDKIGQMLIVGFRGTEINDTSAISGYIEDLNLGGVVLFELDAPTLSRPRNIESPSQVQQLVSDLKSYSTEPLFIAIDQEGGFVDRLKESYGFPPTVTAQHLGEVNSEDTTRYWANSCASTLEDMGINLNFAPVVDLNINPDSPAIGYYERSFSADADTVIFHSKIWIEEHHNRDLLCSIKHFPGHGSATDDSHLGITDITETWSESELIPYDSLISEDMVDMVMTAHVYNRNLDNDYPATMSSAIIGDILRGDLGYHGVIISDDMQMGAIVNEFGMSFAIEKAIDAGVDMMIFSNNGTQYNDDIALEAYNIIVSLIEDGSITEERIDESYVRIMALKTGL